MIDVQQLFLRLNADLIKKGLGGFATNDEFNRAGNEVQDIIAEYYAEKFRLSQKVQDAILPFQKYADSQISSGTITLPDDYRHLLSVSYVSSVNTDTEPEISFELLREKAPNEDRKAFRKPTLGKPKTYAFEFTAGSVFIEPSALTGNVRVKYLREPVRMSRGVITNIITDDEDYDSATTVHLEWPVQEFTNFIDLLMYFKGAEVRDSDLMAWATGKKQFQAVPTR